MPSDLHNRRTKYKATNPKNCQINLFTFKSKFRRALETSQRNVKEIKERDAELINDVDVVFEDVIDGIDQRALELTASVSDFVKDREAVDLFSSGLFDVSYIEKLPDN